MTTTGTVYITKPSGIATFSGVLNAGTLIVNGYELDYVIISTPLTHNITGNLSILSGTLKPTTCTLNIGGNFMKYGSGSFKHGSGTVNFNGTLPQQTNVGHFNNLKINNNSGVTLTAATTMNASIS